MKTKILFLIPMLALLFSACEKDIKGYDEAQSYIYFNMPYVLDNFHRETNQRIDSLFYSFGLDDIDITDMIIKVPVNIIGVAADHDRAYQVEVVAEETTAKDSEWDKSAIANTVIRKGELRDTLYVKVYRSEESKTQLKRIVLRIVPNEEFQAGYSTLLKMKVSFTSILTPPDWWEKWSSVFGAFSREKFVKWQEIYYLGADPNLNDAGDKAGQPLYWDNMPLFIGKTSYPSTHMFIAILKQYFIDNEVYPDGDTSQPRISIP